MGRRFMVSIGDIQKGRHIGETVELRGWIYRTRTVGGKAFVVVRDSTGIIQVTISKDAVPPDAFAAAEKALIESAVEVTGTVTKDKRAPGGRFPCRALRGEVPDPRGPERRVPPRRPPSLGPVAAHDGDLPHPSHGVRCGPRVLPRAGVLGGPPADDHLRGERRWHDPLRAGVLRPQGPPHAIVAAVRRSARPRDGEDLLHRTVVPRGKIPDDPPSHGVLACRDGAGVGGDGRGPQTA